MLRNFLFFALVGCGSAKTDETNGSSSYQTGTTPESGVVYDGGEKIYLQQYGLSFLIPDNWKGETDGSAFVLYTSESDAVVMLTAARISEDDLEEALEENIELGDDVWMVPEDNPSQSGNTMSAPYDVTGEQDGSSWKGYISTVMGSYDWTAINLGLSPSNDEDFMVSAIDDISDSVTLMEPDEGADFAGDWKEAIAGYTFTHYESGNDYHDKTRFTVCQDGSASYYSNSYSGGITGSLSYTSAGEGSWEIEYSSSNSADVYFTLTNDLSGTREFTVDGEGKFYINDTRYYRESNGC